jgi:hypothetical protein
MSVPETSVHENDGIEFWQHNIWFSRKYFIMQFVPKTTSMEEFPYQHFWFGILPFDPAHVVAPYLRLVNVCHADIHFIVLLFGLYFIETPPVGLVS